MLHDSTVYDVIILGLGVMGSATAYHLAREGKRVLVLEQFEIANKLGSSYGESRIIRYAYDHPVYVQMAKAAFPMWRELQHRAAEHYRLLVTTGGLDFGRLESATFLPTRDTLTAAGIPFDWLTAAEVRQRLPQFHLDEDMLALYQPDAGYLNASQCVIYLTEEAIIGGVRVLTRTKAERIDVLTDSVRVHTADGQYEAGKLIITAGPWAGHMLESLDLKLPLQPTREELVFFEPKDRKAFLPESFPIFIYHTKPWFYGLPNVGGTGVKVAVHGRHEPTDPDQVNRTPDQDYIAQIRRFVHQYLPDAEGKVNEARVCMYTMTPDEHFIIDHHPAHPHIVIGAGFSGHGFKFGILIGRILADLALRGQTDYDISLFSVNRFDSPLASGSPTL